MNQKLFKELQDTQLFANLLAGVNFEISCVPSGITAYRYSFGDDVRYISSNDINVYLRLQLQKAQNFVKMASCKDEDEFTKLVLINNDLTLKAITYYLENKEMLS